MSRDTTATPAQPQALELADLARLWRLIQRYYAGDLRRVDPETWAQTARLKEGPAAQAHSAIALAIGRLAHPSDEDAFDFEYEFNRLFIGPGHALAAPYASVYLSEERTLMGQATLSARAAYEAQDMVVDRKNNVPDDHFAYEAAFMAQMSETASSDGAARDARGAARDFLRTHIACWVPLHVQAIRDASENELCLAFADLLCALADATEQALNEDAATSEQTIRTKESAQHEEEVLA